MRKRKATWLNKEIGIYLVFGFLTTFVNMGSYFLLVSTILDAKVAVQLQIANFIAWLLAVLFAFFTNRKFVFKSKEKNIFKEFLKFVNIRIMALFIDMFIMYVMVTVLDLDDMFAKLFVQGVVTVFNYTLSKLIVFKKNK